MQRDFFYGRVALVGFKNDDNQYNFAYLDTKTGKFYNFNSFLESDPYSEYNISNGGGRFANLVGGGESLGGGNRVKWDYWGIDNNDIDIVDQLNISAYGMGTIASLLPTVLKNSGAGRIAFETLTVATKFTSEKLFGVGLALTAYNVIDNKGSLDPFLWAVADTGMSYLTFIPIPPIQLIAGLYVGGRIIYQVYKEEKSN